MARDFEKATKKDTAINRQLNRDRKRQRTRQRNVATESLRARLEGKHTETEIGKMKGNRRQGREGSLKRESKREAEMERLIQ